MSSRIFSNKGKTRILIWTLQLPLGKKTNQFLLASPTNSLSTLNTRQTFQKNDLTRIALIFKVARHHLMKPTMVLRSDKFLTLTYPTLLPHWPLIAVCTKRSRTSKKYRLCKLWEPTSKIKREFRIQLLKALRMGKGLKCSAFAKNTNNIRQFNSNVMSAQWVVNLVLTKFIIS